MRNFLKTILASALGFILAQILIAGAFFLLIFAFSFNESSHFAKKSIENNSILYLPIQGEILEDKGSSFLDWDTSPLYKNSRRFGVWQAAQALKVAQEDKKIKGVYLKIMPFSGGWASLSELRNALSRFKESGKFIYSYGENFDEKGLFLASISDKIYMYPEGSIELNGISTSPMFIKGTLEKLGIKPYIFKVGEFKSAVEMFQLNKMSDPSRLQTQELLNEIWLHALTKISESRQIDVKTLSQLSSNLSISNANDALKNKLIDLATKEDELIDTLKGLTSTKKDQDLELVHYSSYFSIEIKNQLKLFNTPHVALIFAQGDIHSGFDSENRSIASEEFLETLRDIEKNEMVKAVVIRVNSPGGSALAADVIWRQLISLKKTKPIIISFGDVAASGGYYLSAGADYIFSDPMTITGSIGVFGVLFNTKNLLETKLGITTDLVSTEPYADIGSGMRDMTEFEQNKIQNEVNNTYQQFLRVVQQGRKFDNTEKVDQIARGRVWSGIRAQKIGLVDEIGGLNSAILKAMELSKLTDSDNVKVYPKSDSSLQEFVELLGEVKVQLSSYFVKSKLLSKAYKVIYQIDHAESYGNIWAVSELELN